MSIKQHRVLATKYRPVDFDSLIGQEVLVRTLSNAISLGRIPNAFLLTGIRGVGKTTTARIIARALNCTGPDDKGGATIKPCGVCSNCLTILEERNPDVIEMDAASRTGVDDVREVIENTHYKPLCARYKIYIIDEVHMLSKSAFNALLKTLEEPPSHVKFIFATTEIRKIPITILSRCMRFDLKRIDNDTLSRHIANIAVTENIKIERSAVDIVVGNSEGSVRDSLSLLDQLIAQGREEITAEVTREVLGLADKSQVIKLFNFIISGEIEQTLKLLNDLYVKGGDVVLIFNDLLDFCYLVTKLKAAPDLFNTAKLIDHDISDQEFSSAKAICDDLEMPYLTRIWQMLLKGISEMKQAHSALKAAEMILIRLCFMSDLPTPQRVIEELKNRAIQARANNNQPGDTVNLGNEVVIAQNLEKKTEGNDLEPDVIVQPVSIKQEPDFAEKTIANQIVPTADTPKDFNEIVELFRKKGEILLYNWLLANVKLVSFTPGRLEFSVCNSVAPDFNKKVTACLEEWTGMRWLVVIAKDSKNDEGARTILETRQEAAEKLKSELAKTTEVSGIMELFPGAAIAKVEEV